MRNASFWLLCACGAAMGGCGEDSAEERWRGADPHLVVHGSLAGEDLDVVVSELADVANADIRCEREYDVPLVDGKADLAMARFVGFEITAKVLIGQEERELEIDVQGPNIAESIGRALDVVPDGSDIADGQVMAEAKWTRLQDEAELLDESAASGQITVELLGGTPEAGSGIIPDGEGSIGVAGELRFSATQKVELSITAKCGENDVEELAEDP